MSEEEKLWRSKKYSGIGNPMYGKKRDEMKEWNIKSKSKPVEAVRLRDNIKLKFYSQRSASRVLGLDQSRVWLVLNGKARTTGGYIFKYI